MSLIGILVGCSSSTRPTSTITPQSDLVIVASCDTQGWIEPCGCASGQSGGLSRRATLAKELAEDHASLLVSAGGAISDASRYDVEKLRAILAGESAMGYAVHNVGLGELLVGIDRVVDSAKPIQFVSTNSSHPGSQSAQRSVTISRGGWRLLVLGVIQPGLKDEADLTDEAAIEDPESAILREVEANRGRFDAVILLAYMDADSLRSLAENLPEVDVIIGGMTKQSISPTTVGRTLLTAVSSNGKFLARVSGKVNDSSRVVWTADLHEVADSIAEDMTQQNNLATFRDLLRELDLPASDTSFVTAGLQSGDPSHHFAGSAACVDCHELDQHVWHDSTHSHAWETLVTARAEVDSDCQRCHTVGYGLPGGFVSRSESMNRVDVGCESCHGPSSEHVQDTEVRTPWRAAESCLSCHDHENSPQFEFESYWAQISHGPAEATDVAK